MSTENKEHVVSLLLRIGVAFAFLYPPIDALSNPYSWIGYFPTFLLGIIPDLTLLHLFGVVEVVLALWILSGKRIFLPSCIATIMLMAIVIANPVQFEVIFRDFSIACAAGALAVLSYASKQYQ